MLSRCAIASGRFDIVSAGASRFSSCWSLLDIGATFPVPAALCIQYPYIIGGPGTNMTLEYMSDDEGNSEAWVAWIPAGGIAWIQ